MLKLFQYPQTKISAREENVSILPICIPLVCNTEKLRFIKEQKAGLLLSSLGIKTPGSNIPSVGSLLF